MNAYQLILAYVENGMEHLAAAFLSIFFYLISAGTLTQNNMTSANLTTLMTSWGYTYDVETDTFNDGTTDYSIYQLISAVITNYYADLSTIDPGTMNGLIDICKTKNKITTEQQTAILALVQSAVE